MSPGLRGTGNLASERMPIAIISTFSIDPPKKTAMRDAFTICSP
jgi:hypothetical protein